MAGMEVITHPNSMPLSFLSSASPERGGSTSICCKRAQVVGYKLLKIGIAFFCYL
jgi:hypothetical protein